MIPKGIADLRSQTDFVEGENFSLFVIPAGIVPLGFFFWGAIHGTGKQSSGETP
jgi:hypothetical protein